MTKTVNSLAAMDRGWPVDTLGQILTMAQELRVRAMGLSHSPLTVIAREVSLPVDLVREVIEFGQQLELDHTEEFFWYGERAAEAGEKCPVCWSRLTVAPCRACRMRQWAADRRKVRMPHGSR